MTAVEFWLSWSIIFPDTNAGNQPENLTSTRLYLTQRRMAVFTLRSGLSSAIIVMLRVFTCTLSWTEFVHMSRMIHLLAWAYNPLHLRWIIYTTLPHTPLGWHRLSTHSDVFPHFHLPDGMWNWPTQLLNMHLQNWICHVDLTPLCRVRNVVNKRMHRARQYMIAWR